MENIGGKVWFCHFWIDHDSMVQLTEDCNGEFTVAHVLDTDASPEVRREAALLAQKELADCMQKWGITLLDAPVPEQMKYASLAEAASHLMQVLNDPESIVNLCFLGTHCILASFGSSHNSPSIKYWNLVNVGLGFIFSLDGIVHATGVCK